MKRALPGKKRKQATPARKPAAKRSKIRPKTKVAKAAVKKASSSKKTKPRTAKASKVARKKTAKVVVTGLKVSKRKSAPRKRSKPKARKHPATELVEAKPPATAAVTALPRAKQKVAARAPKTGKARPEPKFTVPAFLLEGDEPSHPASGSGEKFVLGPTPPLDHFDEAKTPLPESYGTGKLFLTARDPHWLYAHWDFTMQEQFRYNSQSMDRHMVLRLHDATKPGRHISEIHVHPESRHWFTHVDEAGKIYSAEIGYYQAGRKWKSLATSAPQRTPPDNISTDSTVKFATIPTELSFETMLALLKETAGDAVAQTTPLAHAVDKIRPHAREHFPNPGAVGDWSAEQQQALADVLAADRAGSVLPSSDEFTPTQPGPEFTFDFETGEAAPLSSYVSSFFGGEVPQDFWFNVNAELIVYGATEPNATVTFAGKPVPLRKDGSFRFHFALPDGQYELPVTAVSADGTDGRAAELKFSRKTEIRGHVKAQPHDPTLSPPPPVSKL